MPNALARESSPYLLQHANNPVDWRPWGDDALARAKAEDKPIFLSIGYAACHWCHVMEHESFENDSIAALLNEHFVSVKVDREERPDLDHVYMAAVQAISGRGGWPMSVFLTPDGKPIFGGTYWPPTRRMGMPGFDEILMAIIEFWRRDRERAVEQARQIAERVSDSRARSEEAGVELSLNLLSGAEASLERIFDSRHGGFGGAPKFPHPMDLRLLLRQWSRRPASARRPREESLAMTTQTLDQMAAGGIYDHLAGGFHRYSVDERWLVPHFEKMLYDNGLLATCCVEAFLATGAADYARVARETLDWLLTDMRDGEGGFHSTLDADSEGHEGKYYVWTPAEIGAILGAPEAATFCRVYDVSEGGNFEGTNILNLPKSLPQMASILGRDLDELSAELARSRAALLAERKKRIPPALDDKVLTNWNALVIEALALAGRALDEPRYVAAAREAAAFILGRMRRADGRLLHAFRRGEARFDAYLDDYAYLAHALVELYQATFDETYIDRAVELAEEILSRFADEVDGGFFYTARDHESLYTRHKDLQDASVPSAMGMTATALVRLGRLCGRTDFLEAAQRTLAANTGAMQRWPTALGQMLLAADAFLGPAHELVVVGPAGDATGAVLRAAATTFLPRVTLVYRDPCDPTAPRSRHLDPIVADRASVDGRPTLYVCREFACEAPVVGREAAVERISTLGNGG